MKAAADKFVSLPVDEEESPLADIPTTTPWLDALARRNDKIIGDERNALAAMRTAPELRGLVRFNQFAHNVEFTRTPHWRQATAGDPWTDDDDLALQAWLQELGVDIRQRNIVGDTVTAVSKENPFHPVRAYFDSLTWDGKARLDKWLSVYLNADGDENYLTLVGPRFLISSVARILRPGAQVDHVLVLEGAQGVGKSSAARKLAIRFEWFADDMPDIHSKDAALQLCGKFIVELAELAAMRRAEIEGVKAFVTRTQDTFRPPYARRAITVPRQCVFIATTNETHYLRDNTGNRRFWPVKCARIDIDALARDRDQLFAEAVTRYNAGEIWHLTQKESQIAAAEQSNRLLISELEADVADYLDRMHEQGAIEISIRQVLVGALHLDAEAPDFAERAARLGHQVAGAMERAGWLKVRRQGRGENRRTTYRRV